MPCIARERRTAGAPSDLMVRYLNAGASIGDPCINIPHTHTHTSITNHYNLVANKLSK